MCYIHLIDLTSSVTHTIWCNMLINLNSVCEIAKFFWKWIVLIKVDEVSNS